MNLIIADDLTGAADTGAVFAQRGLATVIALKPPFAVDMAADVLVVSTDSRHLPAEQAAAAVRSAVQYLAARTGPECPAVIYKKIDSTLRGHPAEELAALIEAAPAGWGIDRALIAPAFPQQGRTTAGGVQRVDGMPVERTAFGREVAQSDLLALFGACLAGWPVQHVGLDAVRGRADQLQRNFQAATRTLWVADATSDDDLAALAVAASGCVRLLCGSAGLARALAIRPRNERPAWRSIQPSPYQGAVLIVAGSRNPVTARQVEAARAQNMATITPSANWLIGRFSNQPDSVVTQLVSCLADGRGAILTTTGSEPVTVDGIHIARRLAQVAADVLARVPVGGLVLTGGDIAAAVCDAVGADTLRLEGEVVAGIAAGRLVNGRYPGLRVVTKAGGFGNDDALVLSVRALMRRPETRADL